MKIKSKIIAVTGAGGGIGGAIVSRLIERGAEVAAIDLKAESMTSLIEKYPGKVTAYAVNITDRQSVDKLPEQIIADLGAIDGIIHCAGIIQPFVKVTELDYDAIDKVINVNLYGTIYINKAFLPHLLKRPEAHLVNFSSMGGFLPVPGQAIYGASKAGVNLLTEALYAELLSTNVGVSVVFPGATETSITQNSGVKRPKSSAEDAKKYKMLAPEKVAELVVEGVEKNKLQIFTGTDSNFMNRFYRFSPTRATGFIAKKMASLLE